MSATLGIAATPPRDSHDARRLWAPRFHPASLSQRTGGLIQLCIRAFLFLYAFCLSVWNRTRSNTTDYDAAYLTYWGVWLVVFHFFGAFVCSLIAWVRPDTGSCADPHDAPFSSPYQRKAWIALIKITRLIFSIAVPVQLVIVVIYWLLLASPQSDDLEAWSNIES
jgi:hypothetical protein